MTESSSLSVEDQLAMYRWMLLTRRFEDRAHELWTEGRVVESLHGSQGQEAVGVGACYGLRPGDQVVPSLRTRSAFLVRGVPARQMLAGLFAKATGAARGKATAHHMAAPDVGVMLGSAIVGASIPVAVGAALAFKMQRRDSVVVCFFGDGAAQRGDFHEALNFAGVLAAPVIFVLENNGYAEMTPLSTHFAGDSLAARAAGYGFPGVAIDGNDVLEVHATVTDAARRARAGAGPTLIEAVTYRQGGHSASHPPTELRDPKEVEEWLARDPLMLFKERLEREGVLDTDRAQEIAVQVDAEIEEAVDFAESSRAPDPEELYRDVYAPTTTEAGLTG